MSIKGKIMEAKENVQKKWKEANEKYPWLKTALIAGGVALIGGGVYYYNQKQNEPKTLQLANTVDEIDVYNTNGGMIKNTADGETFFPDNIKGDLRLDEMKKNWEENYKDNWDEVIECVKRLNLKPGEMFIIEDQKQYIGKDNYFKVDPNIPIVSHLIDGTGCYPPDESND